MGAKLFVLGFVLLIGLSVWFQKSYMANFGSELVFDKFNKNAVQELIAVRPFESSQYAAGIMKSQIKAKEMRYFNNGRVVLIGDIQYTDHDSKGKVSLVITTEKALGEVVSDTKATSFLNASKKLKSVILPEVVRLKLSGDDVIMTKNVDVDFVTGVLKTVEDVELLGPGKQVRGKGFVYQMNTQEYRMGGPIQATLLPSLPSNVPASNNKKGSKL